MPVIDLNTALEALAVMDDSAANPLPATQKSTIENTSDIPIQETIKKKEEFLKKDSGLLGGFLSDNDISSLKTSLNQTYKVEYIPYGTVNYPEYPIGESNISYGGPIKLESTPNPVPDWDLNLLDNVSEGNLSIQRAGSGGYWVAVWGNGADRRTFTINKSNIFHIINNPGRFFYDQEDPFILHLSAYLKLLFTGNAPKAQNKHIIQVNTRIARELLNNYAAFLMAAYVRENGNWLNSEKKQKYELIRSYLAGQLGGFAGEVTNVYEDEWESLRVFEVVGEALELEIGQYYWISYGVGDLECRNIMKYRHKCSQNYWFTGSRREIARFPINNNNFRYFLLKEI